MSCCAARSPAAVIVKNVASSIRKIVNREQYIMVGCGEYRVTCLESQEGKGLGAFNHTAECRHAMLKFRCCQYTFFCKTKIVNLG